MKEQSETLMLRDATNDFELKFLKPVTFDQREFITLESFVSYMDKSSSNRIITTNAVFFLFKGRFYSTGDVYEVSDIYAADEIEVIISQVEKNIFISCENYDVRNITNYEFVKKFFDDSDDKSNVGDDVISDEETKNEEEEKHDDEEADKGEPEIENEEADKGEPEIENEETKAEKIKTDAIEDQKYRDEFFNQEITFDEITKRLDELDMIDVFTRSERIESEVLRIRLAILRIGGKPNFLANGNFKIDNENLGNTNDEENKKKETDKIKNNIKSKSNESSNKERKENVSKLNNVNLEHLIERLAKLKPQGSEKSKTATTIDRDTINVFTKNHRISCLKSKINTIEKTLKEAITNDEKADLEMNAIKISTEDEKIERKNLLVERKALLQKLQTTSDKEIKNKQKLIESVEDEDKVNEKIFVAIIDMCSYHGLDFPKTKIKRLKMETDFNYIMNLIDLHNAYVLMNGKGESGELPNKIDIFNRNCQLTEAEQFEYDLIEKSTFKGFELTSDRLDYVIEGLKNMHVCIICLHFAYFNLHTVSTLGHWTKGINVLFTTENDHNLKISLYNLCKRITAYELNILMAAAPVISYILSELPTSKFYTGKASLSFIEGTVYVKNRNNFVSKVVEKFSGPNQKDITTRASMTIDKALGCLGKLTEKQYDNVNKRIQFLKLDVAQTQTQVPQEANLIPQAIPQETMPTRSILSYLRR